MGSTKGFPLWLLMTVALVACAAGPNPLLGLPDGHGVVAGFWRGLWQGMIAPVTFVISLLSESVTVYEVHNSGALYNLGFLLGVSITLGGGASGSRMGRRRR